MPELNDSPEKAEKDYGHIPDRVAWDLPLAAVTTIDSENFQVFRGSQLNAKTSALSRTDELGMYAARYRAGGGENGLHSHPGDSIWLLVSGAATFWAKDSVVIAELQPLDGVMVPNDAKYRFMCTEDSVLLRFSGPPPAPRKSSPAGTLSNE